MPTQKPTGPISRIPAPIDGDQRHHGEHRGHVDVPGGRGAAGEMPIRLLNRTKKNTVQR